MQFWNSVVAISTLIVISHCREVSYDELKILKAECHPYDTCNTTRENIEAPLRSCQCDNLCPIYGDCCVDAPKRSQMERVRNRNNICLEVNDYQAYFVVSTCKSGWRNYSIRLKCERSPSIEDPLTSIPATSNKSKITYRNHYCASCNEDSEDLIFWKIGVICPELDGNFSRNIADNLVYNHRYRQWGVRLPNNTFISCQMKLAMPENKQNLRFCYSNMKTSCSSNWNDNFIREKCESYTAVLMGSLIIEKYRNVHCAICNGINIKDLNCPSLIHRKLPGSPNFTHLFDVEINEGNKVGTNSKCSAGEVWDSAFKRCRKLSCGLPFLELKNGSCVPKS